MYDFNQTSDDIQENINRLGFCFDDLDTTIHRLEQIDKKYFNDLIKSIKECKDEVEYEIDGLEEEMQERLEEEQKEYKAEMREMNLQFERSRI